MNATKALDPFELFLICATAALMLATLVLGALVATGHISSECQSYKTVGKMRVCED